MVNKKQKMKQKSDEKSEDNSQRVDSAVLKVIKEMFNNIVLSNIVSWFKSTMDEIQDRIYNTVRVALESFLSMLIMIIGIAMVIVSLPFLLNYYFKLPVSLFAIFIGLILMIISIISLGAINKTKYAKKRRND